MKNILSIMFLFALLASSCSEDELVKNSSSLSNSLKFTASFEENESRTYVEEGNLLRWTEGDQISLFVANTLNQQYLFEGETGDNSGYFKKINNSFGTGNDLNCHYAVYPYSPDMKITDHGVITATLPAEQSYAENSFGLGANTMVAVTEDTDDTYLKFRNVGGYLKLQLYGDDVTIKSITLRGNNNEKLAGQATITPIFGQNSTICMANDATKSITLDCGENGVKIGTTAETTTAFWIVVPPTMFENGFEITITDVNGGTFTKSTFNSITIERNVIKPMATFKVEIEETILNRQILYTATSKVQPMNQHPWNFDTFGANIIEHVWDNSTGRGIITFDSNVTTIGYFAFAYCNMLTSVSIPRSVTTIGESAFSSCQHITEFEIPDNVTTIDEFAFHGCSNLTNIIIPNNVTVIGDNAFGVCNKLANITIGEKVTYIGKSAFNNCHKITDVVIPNSVITIKEGAFSSCSELKNVTIGSNVTTIERTAFGFCLNLTRFQGKYASEDGKSLIIDGVLNAFATSCNAIEYIIPDGVTTIGKAAFWSCESLTDITIPNSITTIEDEAFIYCTSLNSITIPEKVKTIGNKAFDSCRSLANLHCLPIVPPLLGENALDNWDGYKYIHLNCNIYVPIESLDAYKAADYWKELNLLSDETIPNNQIWYTSNDGNVVTPYRTEFGATITSNTYGNGKGIITFDGDLTSIGGQAFRDCSSLTSITIPNSVISIGDYAFTFCGSLTSVTIPNNVTRIGEGSFRSCNSLTSITIPNNVTSIGNYAFNVSSLTRVDVKATTPPTINYDTFNKDKGSDLKIYVPAESLEAYKATNCWKDLNIIEEGSKIIEVDLGLSVKWANCNIGASSPEEYGDYFAWGDTKTKSEFYENNCITYGKDGGQLISYGFVDRDVLKAQYDAATINWGKYWRMPTQKEMQELVDNCTWTWTTQNGVKGCLVTGSNGNSIFLPAAGYRTLDLSTIYPERCGHYWTSTVYDETVNDDKSHYVVFGWDDYSQNSYYYQSGGNRSYGLTIRPVQE